MKVFFCAFSLLLALCISSCKKCYNCQNICYTCNHPNLKSYCSGGTHYSTVAMVEANVIDLRSSGYECDKIAPTINDDICVDKKSQEEFEAFFGRTPQYKCELK